MSAAELRHLRSHVIAAIQSIDYTGACERLSALRQLPAISAWDGGPRPLSDAPALVLYAEKRAPYCTKIRPRAPPSRPP